MAHVDPRTGPSSRAHRQVRWHTPPPGKKRRPGVLDTTRAELVRGLEERQGSLWLRVCRAVIVAGYPLRRALHRVRGLRADGAASLLAMAVAMLYLADVRTGFIGRPRKGGGPWHRYTLKDLAQLAYGAQTVAELRRARRALDMMISLGWAFPAKQVRRYCGEETWRSEPGVRRLNLGLICKMTGTTWLLKRDRKHADATRGDAVASIEAARQQRQSPRNAREARTPAPGRHDRPRATGDPPARALAMQQIGQIFGDLIKD